ncbi:MAG: acetate--CoA ligase family protein [Anaerolineae bacterium]|nr:acetate--CoA ligase family protein [Anaerolineae bacterium]
MAQSSPHSEADGLDVLFCPGSVAVIGASRSEEKIGHAIVKNILESGYAGEVYPVNPKADEILGLQAYSSVKDVSGPVDLAVIVIPAKLVLDVMEACGQKGVRAAIVVTAGFGETGREGARRERRLLEIARQHGVRVLGPNCLGVIDTVCPLNASFAAHMPDGGGQGFMSQSGALCVAVLDLAVAEGIGFSRFVSLGNKADVDEVALLRKWEEDEQTGAALAYIEGLTDGRAFLDAARCVAARKPVVALKSGTTEAGSQAVSSHTGSLAGSARAYQAAFRKAGVLQAQTWLDLFDWGLALTYQPALAGSRIAIVTNAGGPGILTTDALGHAGLALARFEDATLEALRDALPEAAAVENPVDVLGDAGPPEYAAALEAVLDDGNVDGAVVILTPQILTDVEGIAQTIVDVAQGRDKPVLGCFMGEETTSAGAALLNRNRLPNYRSPNRAVNTLQAMWRYAEYRSRPESEPEAFEVDGDAVRRVLDAACREGSPVTLVEVEARDVMAAYGIPLPPARLASSAGEAVEAAEEIGFPVALKIASPDVLHKSDVGGIELGLADTNAVKQAYDRILSRARQHAPEGEIWGVLVQAMVAPGREVIVGVNRDAQFGPLVMFGLGGIYVEVLEDVTFRLAPVTAREAEEMLDEIKAAPLLHGARGEDPADLAAIAEIVQRVSQLVCDFPEIVELDLNPVIVHQEGAVAIDARLSVKQPEECKE